MARTVYLFVVAVEPGRYPRSGHVLPPPGFQPRHVGVVEGFRDIVDHLHAIRIAYVPHKAALIAG
jgi:hypothetical protein